MTDRKWWGFWWDWRAELEPWTRRSALERSRAHRSRAFPQFRDTVRDDAPCCTSKLISSSAPTCDSHRFRHGSQDPKRVESVQLRHIGWGFPSTNRDVM